MCVYAVDLLLILTIIFNLTWISERADIPQAVGLFKLLRLLHTVPACTKVSRKLLDIARGQREEFQSNIGIKVINGIIFLATVMMILVYLVVTVTNPQNTSVFWKGVVELKDMNAVLTAVQGLSQSSKYKPLFLTVDGAVVFQWVDQRDFPSRARLLEEYHSSYNNITLFVDRSDVVADEALQNLIVSLTIISFMMLFAILAYILLYQSMIKTIERLIVKAGGIQTISRVRHQTCVDEIEEVFGDNHVDQDLEKFESTIEHIMYQLSPESMINHLELNPTTRQWITHLTGSKNMTKSRVKHIAVDATARSWPQNLAINSWSLDILSQDLSSAVTLVMLMFDDLSLIHPSDTCAEENLRRAQEQMSFVSSGVLYNFIMIAQANYPTENAYHNFYHSIDVTHATFLIIKAIQQPGKLSPLEKFSLLIAALSHDMEHPGLNNAYLVRTRHPLAIRYNDMSVLENMHACRLFEIASSCCNANVFQDLDDSMKTEARRIIIHSIIHTDMSKHFPMVSRMEIYSGIDPAAFESDDDRLFLAAIILHAADISNPARDTAVASKWAGNILTELFAQGDLEKSMGHDVSPMCDRTQTCLYQTQKNFIDFIVLPFYRAMTEIFPDLEGIVDRILKTRDYWVFDASQ
ncbi:hypothetical protein M9435_004475 [Picochlorum sp. BPE23]|nr:hypothetical protein M9435_004475 [Picochlorum sp. BPE23]